MRSLLLGLVLSVPLCPGAPVSAVAQSSAPVRAAIQLAAEGRGDSARRVLDSALARGRTGDSSWVEALFWRARLAAGGDAAARDLRRVVVEFGNSAWADDALLQLAQLAFAGGNPAATLDYAARLRADYPGSDLRARAALWAGRASFEVGEPRGACAYLDSASAEGGGDVEFNNQVLFYRGRCTAAALAAPPARPVSPAPESLRMAPTVAAPPASGQSPRSFEVQVVAARSRTAARDVIRRLGRVGRGARIVPSANVFRVRLGPFETEAAADSVARAARQRVGGRPFVVRLP